MNGRRTPVRLALAGVMLIVAACGGSTTGPGDSPAPAGSAPVGSRPVASTPGPSVARVVTVSDACALTTPGELADVIGFRFLAGHDVTAETGWTTACAWVQAVAAGEFPYNVNIRALADGTLVAFSKMAGSALVSGLADEAYVLDDGRQVAMRFGTLIVWVAGARGIDGNGVPASAVGALARLIASRLEG